MRKFTTTWVCCAVAMSACPSLPSTPDAGPDITNDAGAGGVYAEACGPGTMPVAGLVSCRAVGWESCPGGFAPHPSGWGCVDVLPVLPCGGATRAALGSTACKPLGDCGAPFPPNSASYFVDAAGPVDATHFKTVSAALAAVPEGAIIAIERGTYAGQLVFRKSVTLVGRCPEQVIVVPSASQQAGLRADSVAVAVAASGLTVRGFSVGASVGVQSSLVLEQMLFDLNIEVGLYGTERSTIRATDSVVRNTQGLANGTFGIGVYLDDGVTLGLSGVAVVGNSAAGVYLAAPPGSVPNSATIEDTVVMGTRTMNGGSGYGLWVDGAKVEVSRSLIAQNHTMGVRVDGATARVKLTETVVRDTAFGVPAQNASGAQAQKGAQLEALRSSFIGNGGVGICGVGAGTKVTVQQSVAQGTLERPTNGLAAGAGAGSGAHLDFFDSVSFENQGGGLYVSGAGSTGHLRGSLVVRTLPNSRGGFGRGLEVSFDAGVSAEQLAILESRTHGVVVADATFTATELIVDGVLGQDVAAPLPKFGDGVAATRSSVDLVRPIVRNARGIGLLFSAATGSVDDGFVADNVIGIHFQNGTAVREVAMLEAPQPLTVLVTTTTRFVANQTKVGSGVFALPEVTSMRP